VSKTEALLAGWTLLAFLVALIVVLIRRGRG
jgi:hypothetical protein